MDSVMITVSVFLFILLNRQVQWSDSINRVRRTTPIFPTQLCASWLRFRCNPHRKSNFLSLYQKYLFIITLLNKKEKVTTMKTVMGIVLFSRSRISSSVNCRSILRSVLLTLCVNIIFLAGRKRIAARPMDEIQYQILIASMPNTPPFNTPA